MDLSRFSEALSTYSPAFTSIVGLIADFLSHRRANESKDYDAFVSWLAENRHEELVRLLGQNADTATSIKILLQKDHMEVLSMLEQLDRRVATIAAFFDGFAQVAESIKPGSALSAEATKLLCDFDRTGAAAMLEVNFQSSEGRQLIAIDSPTNAQIDANWRFFEDDVRRLTSDGYLLLTRNSRGHRIFTFTRRAADFVRALPPSISAKRP